MNSKPEIKSTALNDVSGIILRPYITEKTFNMIEKENKLAFIVAEKATKKQIMEAIMIMYESKAIGVNITRTIQGKKAIVKFQILTLSCDLTLDLKVVI